jgi:hypothetical protein
MHLGTHLGTHLEVWAGLGRRRIGLCTCFLVVRRASCPENGHIFRITFERFTQDACMDTGSSYCMCPFSGDEALNSTRKHAACINGVRTNDRDFGLQKFRRFP